MPLLIPFNKLEDRSKHKRYPTEQNVHNVDATRSVILCETTKLTPYKEKTIGTVNKDEIYIRYPIPFANDLFFNDSTKAVKNKAKKQIISKKPGL